MLPRCHGRLSAALAGLLGACQIIGCQSTPKAGPDFASTGHYPVSTLPAYTAHAGGVLSTGPAAARLAPGRVVAWTIVTGQGTDRHVMNGQEKISADGTLGLGPYGVVPVSGMTAEQARGAAERHLASYVTNPQVNLQTVNSDGTAASEGSRFAAQLDAPRPNSVVAANYQAGVPRNDALRDRTRTGILRGQAPTELRADGINATELPSDKKAPDSDTPRTDGSDPVRPQLEALPPTVIQPGQIPHELAKATMPPYIIEPPDLLLIEATVAVNEKLVLDKMQVIRGQHLVRPDGSVNLGIYGPAYVGGLTLDQAREAIYNQLITRIPRANIQARDLNVDILAYNSKWYYVITDGGGYGEQVYRLAFTGNETVLDALSQIGGLPPVSSKTHIWVARRGPGDPGCANMLAVDWIGITQRGATSTNYQVLPGDRIYVKADKWIAFDNGLGKRLAPIERLFGATLLGSSTVNSIKNGGRSSGTGTTP
jgi:polysaccharide export outer membrane protein